MKTVITSRQSMSASRLDTCAKTAMSIYSLNAARFFGALRFFFFCFFSFCYFIFDDQRLKEIPS